MGGLDGGFNRGSEEQKRLSYNSEYEDLSLANRKGCSYSRLIECMNMQGGVLYCMGYTV
jgi:hypothetical protein